MNSEAAVENNHILSNVAQNRGGRKQKTEESVAEQNSKCSNPANGIKKQ